MDAMDLAVALELSQPDTPTAGDLPTPRASYIRKPAIRPPTAKRARYKARRAIRKAAAAREGASPGTDMLVEPSPIATYTMTLPIRSAPLRTSEEIECKTTTPTPSSPSSTTPVQLSWQRVHRRSARHIQCSCGRAFGSEDGRLAHVEKGNHAKLMAKLAAVDTQRSARRSELKIANTRRKKRTVVQRRLEELTVGMGGLNVGGAEQ